MIVKRFDARKIKGGYVQIPNWSWAFLPPVEYKVFCCIYHFSTLPKEACLGVKRIADEVNLDIKTVRKAIHGMEQKGCIIVKKNKGTVSKYIPLMTPPREMFELNTTNKSTGEEQTENVM